MLFLYPQLCDKYQDFVTDSERELFTSKLQETEDWLYEDGEDETKGVYVAKLEELKKVIFLIDRCLLVLSLILLKKEVAYEQCVKLWVGLFQQGDPIEERYKEFTDRSSVIDQLAYCINSYREAALSSDPKFDHIDIAEKQKVPTCFTCLFAPLSHKHFISLFLGVLIGVAMFSLDNF